MVLPDSPTGYSSILKTMPWSLIRGQSNDIFHFLGLSGNWIEIAYGTRSGTVRVIVQHPETLGQGPQIFQTFTVHKSPVNKVMLSEKNLISGNGYQRSTITHSPLKPFRANLAG